MRASEYGHHDIVRTLLQGGADVNATSEVRNQMMMMRMMMMMIIIIVLTIMTIIMMAVNENYN
jgi:ankyrin repeat protein